MVLLSYNKEANRMAAAARQNVLETVRAGLAGIAVRYLPTLLKPLRGKLAAQALDEQLAVFGDQLRGQIEAFVDRFHDWLDAAIDAQVEQAREQLKRTFEEALDDRPDDPAALAAEAETLEALAGRILA